MSTQAANHLDQLFHFLKQCIAHRIQTDLGAAAPVEKPVLPVPEGEPSPLNKLIVRHGLSEDEIIVLLIALTPHIYPNFFDNVLAENIPGGGQFSEFGGLKGKNHRGILPTGETALYIVSGNDMALRLSNRKLLNSQAFLFKTGVLSLGAIPYGEPRLSGQLVLDPEYVELLTTGVEIKPDLSPSFPAELLHTEMTWEQLVLKKETIDEVLEIQTWLKYNDVLLSDKKMGKIIKPGYRVMFYGTSGTGKTMTASLLGKYTNRDVYRIDLSMVVSKYIGETEKNLSSLFNKARNKNWILFFDEADSVFGKRTNVRDAHDKYANQEVSYLLQRIEAHPGLVILASNFKSNIDEAFARRFHSIIEFSLPSPKERVRLWNNSLPSNIEISPEIDFDLLAEKYEITGANIINVIHFACLKQLENESPVLELDYLIQGITKEYIKEGKVI